MPSQPLPRLPRVTGRAVDLRAVSAFLLGLALRLGLATRRPPLATAPPLFPGVRQELETQRARWVTRRAQAAARRRVRAPGRASAAAEVPAPRQPAWTAKAPAWTSRLPALTGGHTDVRAPGMALERQDFACAAARLLLLSVATVVGSFLFLGIASVLANPAASNAKSLLQVELDIPEEASLPALDERSTIYDEEGNLLAVIDREVSRRSLPLSQIPKRVRYAVITAEDRKFYEHEGYDVEGIGRAVLANLQADDIREGGSTITQQLAKSEVGTQKTLERKASELLYALALEDRFTKDELLERYLNQVYFGSRAYGIAAAAEEFFHTTPKNLKTHQAALLASMIRAPNSADPRDQPELALQRRNAVLAGMVEEGYLEAERLTKMAERPLGVKESSPERKSRQPHVVDAVQRELLTRRELGKTRKQRERMLYYGGLRITTTIDLEMQRAAADTIRQFTTGAPTAAIATVDPATGEVKAVASGLNYKELKYDLATQGRRQPGSAMKPFVYAAALEDGFPLNMSLKGASPAYFEGVPGWERDCSTLDKDVCGVSNYGGSSYGTLDMPSALQNSVNTAAAQLTIILGPQRVARMAREMNIDIKAASNGIITESIGLGGLDQGVTPLEMASAYSVFANGGERTKPHLIAKVENRDGEILYKAPKSTRQVLDPAVNSVMIDMMRGVVTGGTGTGAALPSWPVAGKTGTTSNNVDAWFVGYTPVLSTAVWVGHATGQVAMPGMTGGALPATIWRTYMTTVLEGRDVEAFPTPDEAALEDRLADKSVNVPDVVRMKETEALTALGKRKLVGEVREESSSAPVGTVLWQSPGPGETATPGETVYIGVSAGYRPPPSSTGESDDSSDRSDDDESAEGDEDAIDSGKPPEEEVPPEEELPPPEEEEPQDGDGDPDPGNGNG